VRGASFRAPGRVDRVDQRLEARLALGDVELAREDVHTRGHRPDDDRDQAERDCATNAPVSSSCPQITAASAIRTVAADGDQRAGDRELHREDGDGVDEQE
jgi:hypothetical protein